MEPRHSPKIEPVPSLPFEPPADDEGLDLAAYWRTIKRHKWGILVFTFISVVVGGLTALSATPIYRAEVKLLADPVQPNFNAKDQYVNTALVYLFYDTQYEIIKSRTVAEAVVDRLGLVARAKVEIPADPADPQQSEGTANPLEQLTALVREWKQQLNWKAWLPEGWNTESAPDDTDLRRRLTGKIQAGLSVEGGKQTEIINVSYESPDPKQAAEIANAVADAYIDFGLSSRLSGAKKTASWLSEQLESLRSKMAESEAALQAYQREMGMVDTASQQKLASDSLAALTRELIQAQTKRSEAETRYAQVRRVSASTESLGPVLSNQTVRGLVEEEAKLSRKLQEYAERYGDKHPKMIAARSDQREAQRSLQREIDKVVESIRKEYEIAVAQENKILSLMDERKKEISELRGTNFQLAQLERETENSRRLYESFLGRFNEADVAENYDASNVRIIDPAHVPLIPFKPNKPRVLMGATAVGLILGILFAFVRERLDNTFKTTEDLEEKLGLPSLGIVPVVEKKGRRNPPERQLILNPRSPFSENLKHIRTGLLFSNIDRPPRTVLVTSSASGEGKTTLSCNLAASFSQMDRTLLLEVDLRKPVIAARLGIEGTPGLTELLAGHAQIGECVRPMDQEGRLHVIPCGTRPPLPLELLSSDNFKSLLEQLASQFTYIVIDGPPLLAVSDAIVVGHLVDCLVLAVKAESTTDKMAEESLARLRKSKVRPTGAVLCQVDVKRMAYYGGHYYYYDSSYYGSPDKSATSA